MHFGILYNNVLDLFICYTMTAILQAAASRRSTFWPRHVD